MKLVVLGRDGVINLERASGITEADEWEPVPGSPEAIARLSRAGFRVIVATNQQQLKSADFNVDKLHDIHEKMLTLVAECGGSIDSIFFAATGNPDGQGRRQPKLGLLEQIQRRYGIPADEIVVVGDSREDLEAATAAGSKAILVRTGRGQDMLEHLEDFDGVTVFSDLSCAVDALLAEPTKH